MVMKGTRAKNHTKGIILTNKEMLAVQAAQLGDQGGGFVAVEIC